MTVWTNAASDVLRAFSDPDVGVSVTFTRVPVTGVTAGQPTYGTAVTATGAAIHIQTVDELEQESSTRQQTRSMVVAASGMTFSPRVGDTTSIGGVTWKVTKSVAAPDTATPIVYEVELEAL